MKGNWRVLLLEFTPLYLSHGKENPHKDGVDSTSLPSAPTSPHNRGQACGQTSASKHRGQQSHSGLFNLLTITKSHSDRKTQICHRNP